MAFEVETRNVLAVSPWCSTPVACCANGLGDPLRPARDRRRDLLRARCAPPGGGGAAAVGGGAAGDDRRGERSASSGMKWSNTSVTITKNGDESSVRRRRRVLAFRLVHGSLQEIVSQRVGPGHHHEIHDQREEEDGCHPAGRRAGELA